MSVTQLAELVDARADAFGDRNWMMFPRDPVCDAELVDRITFRGLRDASDRYADSLAGGADERVALLLADPREIVFAFFGAMRAGKVAVPLPPPGFLAPDEYRARVARVLDDAEISRVVTTRPIAAVAGLTSRRGVELIDPPALDAPPNASRRTAVLAPEDVAFIQYTSGSTGDPRGAELTHANVLANVHAIGVASETTDRDVYACWLPLHHDMGLVSMIYTLYWGIPYVRLEPRTFMLAPHAWLWAMHRFRATITTAPNFAYQLCANKVASERVAGLNLGAWRLALNGSETVHPSTIDDFQRRFEPHGFRAEAMYPVYGLAECTVAACFPPPGRAPRIDWIDRDALEQRGVATPPVRRRRGVVAVGPALPDHRVRVVDEHDREVSDRVVGDVEIAGPSVMRTYFRDPEATARSMHDGWLRTGDRGYVADGWLHVTGRSKTLIKKAGRSFDSADLEAAVGRIAGVRPGCVAALGLEDPATGTQSLVLLVETRRRSSSERAELEREIVREVTRAHGVRPDVVALLAPHTLLKTSSGKIRHAECLRRFSAGELRPRSTRLSRALSRLLRAIPF
jgi:acyl-CoA synthetase (AMP-forming)/AMP-acid ligase II